MSLGNVWLPTVADGLIRADQVTGIEVHQTPTLTVNPPVGWWMWSCRWGSPVALGRAGACRCCTAP
jgi:hypothetical protein